ncbi:MAG: hypothetical protein Q8N47_22490 [Bryobacterales bacterium]|nr:hypothetical protein [Bryobacterales bacterium]
MIWLLLILSLNAVIPTKWLRVAGVPLGDGISIAVYGLYLMRACVTRRRVGQVYWPWGLCMIVVTISPLIALLANRDAEVLVLTLRQTMHYLFIVLLFVEVKTLKHYRALLSMYLGVALVSSVALQVYHKFPELANPQFADASFRGLVAGEPRIFTSGAGYVLFAAVGLMVLLSESNLLRVGSVVATEAVLLSGLVWTFIRVFFVVLVVCLFVHVTLSVFGRRRSRRFAVSMCSVAIVLGLGVQSSSSVDSLVVRLGGLDKVVMAYEENGDTVAWRVAEATAALESMQGPLEAAFGKFASRFGHLDYVSIGVHIGWIGIYYHFGAVGVVAFGIMVFTLMRRLVRQYWALRNSGDRFLRLLVRAHLLLWIAFTLVAFGGGSFASGGTIIMLAILWHGTSLIEVERMQAPSTVPWRMGETRALYWNPRPRIGIAAGQQSLS